VLIAHVRYFAGIALFDREFVPYASERSMLRSAPRHRKERSVVSRARDHVGSRSVGGIAIRRDAVRADNHAINLACFIT